MTESGYVWIVTEQALNANNTPDGVIGLQLVHAKSEKNHIRVSKCKRYNRIWLGFIYFRVKITTTSLLKSDRSALSLKSIFIFKLQDSVYVLASAIKEMMINETITVAPKDCDDSGTIWETGMPHHLFYLTPFGTVLSIFVCQVS